MPATPRRRPAARRLAAAALALAAALGAGGCARATRALVRPYQLAPSGLEVPEQAMRDDLAAGHWDAAARRAASARAGGPSDPLLRALYAGTADYYAGRYAQSAASFDRAGRLADERFTKRVSRGAAALLTNDRALPYLPGDNERLMAGYYSTLAYLHARDLDGAAVEARRLALALQRADDRRDPADRSLRAALRYLTGAVFEAAGDREDAEVAYRNAAMLGARVDTAVAERAAADSALRGTLRGPRARRLAARARAAEPGPGAGEVVAVIEGGFVAHRVDERLSVRLDGGAAEALAASRGGRAEGALGARLAALLTGDAGLWAGELPAGLALADSSAATDSAATTAAARDTAAHAAGDTATPAPRAARTPTRRAPSPAGPGAGRPVLVEMPEPAAAGTPAVPGGPSSPAATGGRARGRGPFGTLGEIATRIGDAADDDEDDRRNRGARRRGHRGRAWAPGQVFTVAWPAYRRPRWSAPDLGLVTLAAAHASAHAPARAFADALGVATGGPAVAAMPAVAAPATGPAALAAGLGAAANAVVRGDLTAAAAGDFRRDRGALLSRLVARSVVRAALAHEAGRKHREIGDVVRALGNVVEHADTRSWHLLPGAVQVVRLRLPAGEQALGVDVGGRRVPLGTVRVAPGGVRFVSVRLWDPIGERVTVAGVDAPAPVAAVAAGLGAP